MYQTFYAASTSVHVLLAPVTTLDHGVLKGLPGTTLSPIPVNSTTVPPVTVSVPSVKFIPSPLGLTVTPVPTPIVTDPKVELITLPIKSTEGASPVMETEPALNVD